MFLRYHLEARHVKAPKSSLVTPVVGAKSSEPVVTKAVVPTTKPGIRGARDASAKKVAGKGERPIGRENTDTGEGACIMQTVILVSEAEAFLDDARNMLEAAQLQLIWLIKSLEEAKVQAALQVKNLEGDLVCSRQKVSELVQETEGLKVTNEAMKK
ncbi:hypothetical protein EMCRGX_G009672 [Ephydatia muelleri]